MTPDQISEIEHRAWALSQVCPGADAPELLDWVLEGVKHDR